MAAQDRVLAGRNEYDQARDVRVGSALSDDSLSVTLASDQGAVPVSLVDLGQATMSASLPVAIARDQGSLSVAPLVDGISFDSFGRQRMSSPQGLFDAQFTNDLHPLLFEQVVSGTGAAIAHDATNRAGLITFASTPANGKAYFQSFESIRYQPGKSQQAFVTFNMRGGVVGATKFAGLGDGVNGVEFALIDTTPTVRILSDTENGDDPVPQSGWNLDKLNGAGASGIDLNLTMTQIFGLDLQALYVGRVRVGFDIDGVFIACHEFLHANRVPFPYIQTANLAVRCGMVATATVSTTMLYICCTVISEGGQEDTAGYRFTTFASLTAGSGARTHAISLRPKTTFNNIANRFRILIDSIEVSVRGSNPVKWELCIGQALTNPTYADVNATYSAMEASTAGTLSGDPAIVIDGGEVAVSTQSKAAMSTNIPARYPMTLNAAGAQRILGTYTVLLTGIGGTSAATVTVKWKEIR